MAREPIKSLPDANTYYTRLSIGPYERADAFALSTFDEKLVVHLPLPTELRDDTSVSYTNVNLETVGDAFANRSNMTDAAIVRNTGALAQLAMRGTSRGLDKALSGRGGLATIFNAAQGALFSAGQSLLPPDQINSAVQQQLGVAPNPNPSVQFQGPVLRNFTFTWAFYPKNRSESERLDNLFRKLKARALPSNNSEAGSAILNYPHICQLNFFPWDGKGQSMGKNGWTSNSIIKISKCFMENVNVNYHAFGTPAFFEGTQLPVTYQLTISFKEIEYLLSDDWDPDRGTAASAANERTQGLVDGAKAIALVTSEVIPALADIAADTFVVAGGLIREAISDTATGDKIDRGQEVFSALTPGDAESYGEITVPVSEGDLRGSIKYRVVRNADGKFVLTPTTTRRFTGEGPDTETTETGEPKTFDTVEALQIYLEEQNAYADGDITHPPLPESAAPAPE